MGDITIDIKSSFPTEWVKASINISYTAHWLHSLSDKRFKKYGISPEQYNILRILRGAKKAITVSDVKDRMIKKSPNTTRLMDKLCEKKFIDRTRCDSDRRVVFVKITKVGLKLLDQIPMNDEQKVLDNITLKEAKELNRILDKIR